MRPGLKYSFWSVSCGKLPIALRLVLRPILIEFCHASVQREFFLFQQFEHRVGGVFLMSQKPAFLEGSLTPRKKMRFAGVNGIYF
jgi:hypothetical protein